MGDKGGKKDKEKNKQQQVTKHKQGEQKKHDNAPAKKPYTIVFWRAFDRYRIAVSGSWTRTSMPGWRSRNRRFAFAIGSTASVASAARSSCLPSARRSR